MKMFRQQRLKRKGPSHTDGERLQFIGGHLLWRWVVSAHALRFREARGKEAGKAETFADTQRFRHLLAARIANAAHKLR